MAKTAIMIDLETLSTNHNATLLTIGAVRFDPHGDPLSIQPEDTLYIKVDIESCEKYNGHIQDETLNWWGRQSAEAQEAAFDPTDRVDIEVAMQQLYKFCWGCTTVWSHGAIFDIVVCEYIFKYLGKAVPWKYYQARDTRTLFDLGIGLNADMPEATAHNALEDAIAQTIAVLNVNRQLRELATK